MVLGKPYSVPRYLNHDNYSLGLRLNVVFTGPKAFQLYFSNKWTDKRLVSSCWQWQPKCRY